MDTRQLSWQEELVLVTGATGSVGPAIIESLNKAGARVRAVARHEPPEGLFPRGVEFIRGDIADASFTNAIMPRITIVLHLAALVHVTDPPPELRSEYERVNVDGTRWIVSAALRSGVRRLVFFSTISVYGESMGRIFDETTIPCPDGIYAETKLRAERIVLESRRLDGHPLGTVLRLAAVCGHRIKGNYQRLVKSLHHRHFVLIGDDANRRALIHETDVAQAVRLVAHHPAAAGQLFNLSDGKNHTMNEILAAICNGLGRKVPRFHFPVGPVREAASVLEKVAGILGSVRP